MVRDTTDTEREKIFSPSGRVNASEVSPFDPNIEELSSDYKHKIHSDLGDVRAFLKIFFSTIVQFSRDATWG